MNPGHVPGPEHLGVTGLEKCHQDAKDSSPSSVASQPSCRLSQFVKGPCVREPLREAGSRGEGALTPPCASPPTTRALMPCRGVQGGGTRTPAVPALVTWARTGGGASPQLVRAEGTGAGGLLCKRAAGVPQRRAGLSSFPPRRLEGWTSSLREEESRACPEPVTVPESRGDKMGPSTLEDEKMSQSPKGSKGQHLISLGPPDQETAVLKEWTGVWLWAGVHCRAGLSCARPLASVCHGEWHRS